MPLGADVDLDELARTTFGFVGADVAALTREAAIEAVRRIMPRLNLEEGTIPPRGARRSVGDARGLHGGAERSEEHTSELQSLMRISYAVFCLKKKKRQRERSDYTRRTHIKNEEKTVNKGEMKR